MVAKSFQSLKQIGEPFQEDGKAYVIVLTQKGNPRKVRWYSEQEYKKLYSKETIAPHSVNQFKIFGFDKGYITIFRGDIEKNIEWFRYSNARNCTLWGWYIVSTEEVPDDIPEGIEPIKLPWESVRAGLTELKPDAAVKEVVQKLLMKPSVNEIKADIGDRITVNVTVVDAKIGENKYGKFTTHIFEDKDKNKYMWVTSARSWNEGETKSIKGTIKEYQILDNQKITVLTRCAEI